MDETERMPKSRVVVFVSGDRNMLGQIERIKVGNTRKQMDRKGCQHGC